MIGDFFGDHTTSSDFDLGDTGEPDPWYARTEVRFDVTAGPWDRAGRTPPDYHCAGESIVQDIEILTQRPPRDGSDEWIQN